MVEYEWALFLFFPKCLYVWYDELRISNINYNHTLKEGINVADREKGTVKWFNNTKGYGFIQRESEKDVFVHQNAIRNRFDELKEGDSVEFNVVQGQKGLQAEDVTVLD